MSCSKARDLSWPASTCADRQNPPDAVPWGRFRDTLNVVVDSEIALRRGGWTRWGAEFEEVENPDLHGTSVRTLFSWSQAWGNRILLAGSTAGVHRWSPGSGVWSAIAGVPALESDERRSFAAVGDTCIFAGGLGGSVAETISPGIVGTCPRNIEPNLPAPIMPTRTGRPLSARICSREKRFKAELRF